MLFQSHSRELHRFAAVELAADATGDALCGTGFNFAQFSSISRCSVVLESCPVCFRGASSHFVSRVCASSRSVCKARSERRKCIWGGIVPARQRPPPWLSKPVRWERGGGHRV